MSYHGKKTGACLLLVAMFARMRELHLRMTEEVSNTLLKKSVMAFLISGSDMKLTEKQQHWLNPASRLVTTS